MNSSFFIYARIFYSIRHSSAPRKTMAFSMASQLSSIPANRGVAVNAPRTNALKARVVTRVQAVSYHFVLRVGGGRVEKKPQKLTLRVYLFGGKPNNETSPSPPALPSFPRQQVAAPQQVNIAVSGAPHIENPRVVFGILHVHTLPTPSASTPKCKKLQFLLTSIRSSSFTRLPPSPKNEPNPTGQRHPARGMHPHGVPQQGV